MSTQLENKSREWFTHSRVHKYHSILSDPATHAAATSRSHRKQSFISSVILIIITISCSNHPYHCFHRRLFISPVTRTNIFSPSRKIDDLQYVHHQSITTMIHRTQQRTNCLPPNSPIWYKRRRETPSSATVIHIILNSNSAIDRRATTRLNK